jgi:polyphenol oxidase
MANFIIPEWPSSKNIGALMAVKGKDHPSTLEPFWLQQVHGAETIVLTKDTKNSHKLKADASYTQEHEIVCVVRTADCLPILVCDKQGTEIAAIHAGWRGLAAGVIQNSIQCFKAKPSDLLIWLGPAIGPKAFEVGMDVLDAFLKIPGLRLTMEQAFIPVGQEKFLANIYLLARSILLFLNIPNQNIFGGTYCTFNDKEKFYSYRRSKDVGRMASLIWLKKVV